MGITIPSPLLENKNPQIAYAEGRKGEKLIYSLEA
jgi:hypothetical protein